MRTVIDAIADEPGTGTLTVLAEDGVGTTTHGWAAVHQQARRIAAVLDGKGLGRGCRVGLLGDASIDLVAALQAVWLVGGAITMLPLPVRRGQREYADQVRAVVADARLELLVVDDPAAAEPLGPAVSLAELADLAGDPPPRTPVRPDPADLAILQYTSGSTRTPRGVPVSHRNLAANLVAIRQAMQHDRDHPGPLLSWLPLYHDLGLIGSLALPMSCGCSLVLLPTRVFAHRPGAWLEAITRYRPTVSGGPNFAYGLMTRLLRAGATADLSSLRCLLSGGEPVDAATMSAFVTAARPFGLDPSAILPGYGLAEATLAVTFPPRATGLRCDEVDPTTLDTEHRALAARPGGQSRSLVRLGRPVPGTSVRIVAPSGERVG